MTDWEKDIYRWINTESEQVSGKKRRYSIIEKILLREGCKPEYYSSDQYPLLRDYLNYWYTLEKKVPPPLPAIPRKNPTGKILQSKLIGYNIIYSIM